MQNFVHSFAVSSKSQKGADLIYAAAGAQNEVLVPVPSATCTGTLSTATLSVPVTCISSTVQVQQTCKKFFCITLSTLAIQPEDDLHEGRNM